MSNPINNPWWPMRAWFLCYCRPFFFWSFSAAKKPSSTACCMLHWRQTWEAGDCWCLDFLVAHHILCQKVLQLDACKHAWNRFPACPCPPKKAANMASMPRNRSATDWWPPPQAQLSVIMMKSPWHQWQGKCFLVGVQCTYHNFLIWWT